VRSNAVYRMRTTPVLIGIAGDSGAGKTTLCQLLTQLLGEARLTVINGDDYHRWPRGHEKWQVYTHLNIRGSNVHQQLEDAVAMHAGRSIVKGVYDHSTGQFTHPQEIDPSQYIVFSGLHSLALDPMRRVFDLKIFLDPDEGLRTQWKLQRDQQERGYAPEQVAAALAERQPDRQAFILPQRETADLVLRLLPHPPENGGLALEVFALNGYDLGGLMAELEAQDGVTAELQPFLDSRWQALRVAGDVPPERLRALAEAEVPNLLELAQQPRFSTGTNGLMQLIILICLSQRLRWSSVLET
jgi:uridine kinase